MFTIDSFQEFALVSALTRPLSHHPGQINRLHESDAGLVLQPDGSYLAATVDTLLEEYQVGLIRDPFTVGWCTVAHSLSDLAAVAADPVGVLLSITFERQADSTFMRRFFEGAHAALERHSTFCLGGDTSFGAEASFTCTSLGRVQGRRPMTRLGAGPDDALYVTGRLGSGNLVAIARQADAAAWATLEVEHRPVARLAEGRHLSSFARCAIDTSDALLQAMAILAALNNVGIDFHHREELYDPRLVTLARRIGFPLWLANSFGLGEHELLLAVEKSREEAFVQHAAAGGIEVLKVGETSREAGIRLHLDGTCHGLDVPYLLNLLARSASVGDYFKELGRYHERLGQPR